MSRYPALSELSALNEPVANGRALRATLQRVCELYQRFRQSKVAFFVSRVLTVGGFLFRPFCHSPILFDRCAKKIITRIKGTVHRVIFPLIGVRSPICDCASLQFGKRLCLTAKAQEISRTCDLPIMMLERMIEIVSTQYSCGRYEGVAAGAS